MHLIYLIHKFYNLSWVTEINELFHDILIFKMHLYECVHVCIWLPYSERGWWLTSTYYWPFFPAIMKITNYFPFLRAATVANNQLRERPKAPLTFLKKLVYAQKPLISAQSSADVPMQHQDQSNRCNGEVLFHQTASPKISDVDLNFRWMQTKACPCVSQQLSLTLQAGMSLRMP